MTITFREAINLDIPVLVSLERQLFLHDPWTLAQFKEEFAGVPKTRYFVVAKNSDQEIVGYAGVLAVAPGVTADILTIAVIPSYRRQGIAHEFLLLLEKWSRDREAPAIMLEVAIDNLDAIALYESAGYEKISTRKDYYGPALDAFVMRKEFS